MSLPRLQPDIAIQIDLTLATDTPDVEERGDVRLGEGPGMSMYSFHGRGTLNGTIPHPAVVALFEEAAQVEAIKLQKSAQVGALTDSSYVQLVGAGVASIDLGFPMRYSHSALEVCDLAELESLTRLLIAGIGGSAPASALTATTSFHGTLSRHRYRDVRIEGRLVDPRAASSRAPRSPQDDRAAARLGGASAARGLVGRSRLLSKKLHRRQQGRAAPTSRRVGLSAIGPCMLPVDADGEPLMNGVLYGVDGRAAAEIEELTAAIGEETLLERCGNTLTTQSVGPKILWLKRTARRFTPGRGRS